MITEENVILPEKKPPTPVGLIIISILSLLGSLISIIALLVVLKGGKELAYSCNIPVIDAIMRDDANMGNLFMLMKLMLYFVSVAGVVMMLKMKRAGYYSYLAAQALLLLMPFLFYSAQGVDYQLIKLMINMIFALLFVSLFTYFYKLFN
jgi:hypothetical protein